MLEELLPAAPRRGRIVQIGRLGGTRAMLDLERLADRRGTLIGTTFRHRPLEELRTLCTACVRSRHCVIDRAGSSSIDSVFRLDDPEPAAARLCSGHVAGKIVLTEPTR